MNADVVHQLERLALRHVWRRRAAALGGALATAIVLLAVVASVDYALRPSAGSTMRWVATTLASTGLIATVVLSWRKLGQRTTALDAARAVETARPEWGNLFSSGYEFAGGDPDDPRAGSAELRRAVVLRASATLAGIGADAAMPPVPWRRGLLAAFAAMLGAGLLAAMRPAHFAAGATRLANPASGALWPQRHVLEFVAAPKLLPRGGEFSAELTDRQGAMPSEIVVAHRPVNGIRGDVVVQSMSVAAEPLLVRFGPVQESFEVRASGGDDDRMPWLRVDVAPAPTIRGLATQMTPPSYTRLPRVAGAGAVRALAGSSITASGELSEPATSVRLVPPQGSGLEPIDAQLDGDAKRFTATATDLAPDATGDWRVEATTERGMTALAPERLHFELRADAPPRGRIVSPRGELDVLATAIVPVEFAAEDDVGLSAAEAVVAEFDERGKPATRYVEPLAEVDKDAATSGPDDALAGQFSLHMPSAAAVAGDRLAVRLRLVDSRGQESFGSQPLVLRVVGREQMLALIGREFSQVLERLQAAAALQRDVRHAAAERREGVRTIKFADIVQNQARVRAELLSETSSAAATARALQFRLAVNGFDAEPAARQLAALGEALVGPLATRLDEAEQSLQEARAAESAAAREQALAAAVRAQDELTTSLAVHIAALARWADLQAGQRELAALADDQAELQRRTIELARAALAGDARSAAAEQRRLATEQRDVAFRLNDALQRFAAAARREGSGGEQASEARQLRRIVETAGELQVESLAVAAADDLAGGRWASAVDAQQGVAEGLERMLAEFAGWDLAAAQQRLEALSTARREANQLRRDVAALADRRKAGEEGPLDDAADGRRDAARRAEALARQSEALAPAAADDASAAGEALTSPAANAAQVAASKLADAQEKLAAAEQDQRALAADLRLKRLGADAARWAAGQQAIVDSISKLAGPADESLAKGASGQQSELRLRVAAAAEQSELAAAFALALRSAAADMNRVENALLGDAGPTSALSPARSAQRRLEQLRDAIAQQRSAAAATSGRQGKQDAEQREERTRQRSLAESLAQWQLLRDMQRDLGRKTEGYAASAPDERGVGDDANLAALREEQLELAKLARDLSAGVAESSEE